MNTACTKPSPAPKPRFVCHASLDLPAPLMSSARGPKPSIAPKPKVALQFNGGDSFSSGTPGGSANGGVLTSDSEPDEEADGVSNKGAVDRFPAEKQSSVVRSPLKENVSEGLAGEEEEKEEEMTQTMDEDWRLTDSVLTEEPDSLETLWVSEAGFPGDTEDAVEMIDADDMDDDNAGEALADTDGLSMGDISVNSAEEGAAPKELESGSTEGRRGELGVEDVNGNDPVALDADTQQVFLREGDKEEARKSAPGWRKTIRVKLSGSHEEKEMVGKPQTGSAVDGQSIEFHRFPLKQLLNTAEDHVALADRTREPYYVASEDVVHREMISKNCRAQGFLQSPFTSPRLLPGGFLAGKYSTRGTDPPGGAAARNERAGCVSPEDYVEISNSDEYGSDDSDKHKVGAGQEMPPAKSEERQVFLAHLYSRFRPPCHSDADTSLASSLSESQPLSPDDSDFLDDAEGHIVPLSDDTTDTEQDISDEHVYEDPGPCSEGENPFPFHKRTRGMCSRSRGVSSDLMGQFSQRPGLSRFCQKAPATSSSPMLSAMHHRSYNKPQYLSLYPRSLSMEDQDMPLCGQRHLGSPKQRGATCSVGKFSRCSPLSSSDVSTPTSLVEIPPPFELAYITKRPITKSFPSLITEGDGAEKNRKKKSSLKRFLMLKFRRKTESKAAADDNLSFKSSPESGHPTPGRLLDLDRSSASGSPRLAGRPHVSPELPPAFFFYPESQRRGSSVAFLNRSVVRVESFEDRSRVPFTPLPLTKPRSISVPNADTSDYENVPPINADYENLQVPRQRPLRQGPFHDFFERPTRVLSSANETDGYVDMSSLPGFESRTQSPEQETESAYTEAYNVCSLAVGPTSGPACDVRGKVVADEDLGRTSEEEDGVADSNYERQPDGRSRAFYVAKELADSEKMHVKALKLLQEDFREAVGAAVGEEGEPVLDEERLWEILNELPDVYALHRRILSELENRIRQWDENQRIADIFLSRRSEFLVFTTYIGHYDRSMSLLEESCHASPAFAAIVRQFEQESPARENISLKHQLLQVIVRVAQYRMLLTDYLNNLSPDSKEYEDTQAAVIIVSDIADQANDSLKNGKNLLRLVNIEYSVRGQRDLLRPGRVFVKEGTLMKVSRKSRQPRHLFLMNDVLLYTYPQQDGKYRLKNTLTLSSLKVSKPVVESVQNVLRIEGPDITITLSASSFIEREDWFYTLSRAASEHTRGPAGLSGCPGEGRDRLHPSLGEKAPTLVPVSQVMMCMNCTSDFSLTLRRHHCHGCGRIVCRSCSKHRYPLKYMKDRLAKVCDHCYNELKNRGEDMCVSSAKSSPRPARSGRPLSAVFQNIHPSNFLRHRKGTVSFNQVTVSDEGSISGSLHRSKKSKRNWKRLWFLLKDKVLYTYRAQEEKVASESLPLLGFTVKLSDKQEGDDEAKVFQLYHKNTLYYSFRAEDNHTAQRWVNAMEEATVL